MSDFPQSSAEQLDDDKFDNPVGDGLPAESYPPDEPLAVDDPSILGDGTIAEDDLATRLLREEPDVLDGAPDDIDDVGIDLLDPSNDPDRLDDTAELLATEGDEGDLPAEVAAIHVVEED